MRRCEQCGSEFSKRPSEAYYQFEALPHWDELVACLARERPSGRAPETSARMRVLLDGAQ